MGYLFDMQLHPKQSNETTVWFTAKERYLVRYDQKTKEYSCSCMAGTFQLTGKKQRDCKHIKKAKELIEVLGLE